MLPKNINVISTNIQYNKIYNTFIIKFHTIKDQRHKYKYMIVHVRVYIIWNTKVLCNKIE